MKDQLLEILEELRPDVDFENSTDIVMLNGQIHTIKETPSQLIENRYRRDAQKGATVINLLG